MARKVKIQAEESLSDDLLTIGQRLEAARKAKGMSLDTVSKHLCITKKNLTRLECESEHLPRDVYTVGFIRSYSNFLGLDADAYVAEFRGDSTVSLIKPCDESKFPSPLPQAGIPRSKYILASVALVALIVIGVHNNTSDKIALQQAVVDTTIEESQTPTLISEQVPDAGTTSISEEVIDESAPVKESSTPSQVVMKFTADSWVQVSDPAGKVVISRVFKKGDSYPLDPKLTDFKIHTGNAGGITFVVDDHQTAPLGKVGEIRKDLSLSADKIRAESSKAVNPVSAEDVAISENDAVTEKSSSGGRKAQANRSEKNADDSKSVSVDNEVGATQSDPEATETSSAEEETRTDKTVTETTSADGDVAVATSEAGDEEPASKE